jgi:4-oxalocrotonate tautomerase
MPHVILKLQAGRTRAQKIAIANALTTALVASAGCDEDAVSVAIEDVAQADWFTHVYAPDITAKPETIYKQPGYTPPT